MFETQIQTCPDAHVSILGNISSVTEKAWGSGGVSSVFSQCLVSDSTKHLQHMTTTVGALVNLLRLSSGERSMLLMWVCGGVCVCVSRSVVSDSVNHCLEAARLLCPWNSPGKNTGVDCHSLLQRIFPTQELNLGLLHCRQILYHLNHQGSPCYSHEYPILLLKQGLLIIRH